MRDAAGEAADGFHFLRLPQLLLDRLPLGNVHDDRDEERVAVAVPMKADGELRPDERSCFRPVPLLAGVPVPVARDQRAPGLAIEIDVVGMRQVREFHRGQLVSRVAEHVAQARIHSDEPPFEAGLRDADQGFLECRLVDAPAFGHEDHWTARRDPLESGALSISRQGIT